MNKLRFYFSKEPSVKYVGHLDLIEVFDRAFRRAKMPLVFSEGFNPRPKLTFAHPLAVGISSVAEIGEIELEDKVEIEEFINKMNSSLPSGVRILSAEYIESNKSLMALVTSAEYKIELEGEKLSEEALNAFFDQEEIVVDKKNKKKQIVQVNVKDLILDYKIEGLNIWVKLVTGNEKTLRPDLLVNKIYGVEDFRICREKINI